MLKSHYDEKTKIWRGPKSPPIYNPEQGLGSLILKVLELTPNAITQISADTGVSVTCKQMYERSIKMAKYLQKTGLKQGDKIGFLTANSENLPPVVFACFTLGLPINPLSPIMKENDIVQMYSVVKPVMIFCDGSNCDIVENAVKEMKSDAKVLTIMEKVEGIECVADILKEMENEAIDDFEFPNVDPNSTAAILCSSGSTGFPKGICKSHKQIITDFRQLCPQVSQTPVFFQGSAIFWLSGFSALIACVFYNNIRVCTAKALTPQILIDIVNKHKVTCLIVPPFMLVAFLQLKNLQPLESIEFLLIGGAVVSDTICRKFKPYVPHGQIVTGYGCTEQDFIAVNFTNKNYGSSGFPFYNVEIKITDDNGNSHGPNEKGEICTKIPVQFSYYYSEPEKTAETFDGEWFKTGDIGYFDDEGYIYIVDRKKELLKYQNYQVTPSEIEAIINGMEGVTSSCIVGIPETNSGNDIIHALVILQDSSKVTEQQVLDYVNEKVIEYKRIRGGVRFVKTLPLGLTGKVDRKKARELVENYNEVQVTKF